MAKDFSPEAIDKKVERYRAKLMAEVELTRKDQKELRAMVESVFAKYGDVSINLSAVVSLCLQQQNIKPEDWKQKAHELENFVRSHGHQEEWIQIRAGKDGGVRLIHPHIMQGVMGATCKSVIVKKPTHSRKTKTIKRSNTR